MNFVKFLKSWIAQLNTLGVEYWQYVQTILNPSPTTAYYPLMTTLTNWCLLTFAHPIKSNHNGDVISGLQGPLEWGLFATSLTTLLLHVVIYFVWILRNILWSDISDNVTFPAWKQIKIIFFFSAYTIILGSQLVTLKRREEFKRLVMTPKKMEEKCRAKYGMEVQII